ncbi:Outer membrane receptor proteins, mostly Fe transport [Sphingomonas gellani]|uniref:Outer membrane receptor proteins, mostly Fe transport n=1 Tax=Sphingomonas gellani TaxID=1166340 RepID=A0A1H8AZU7_9SPHN|nr:TonB-dependent receptor [Sphingomonas gellani]SEM76252.1 Outer membrane receptor proteins, mostly Fe transport [Sphingomonas gellani]
MSRADRRLSLPAVLLIAAAPTPALSREANVPVAVAAGPLDRALASLAEQARIDIGSTEPGLAAIHVQGVRGHLTASRALAMLLQGTPFRAERIDATTYRLHRTMARAKPMPRRTVPPTPPAVKPAADAPLPPDVIVTAAKTGVGALRLPGAITVMRAGAGDAFGHDAAGGLSEAAATTPILQETALGAGRNKLFIRGVADSSFSGPTQSTAAVYWGDVPVAYTGADPGLNLYDVDRVEVLEGPQGTLYGAGAIGGVIRIAPRAPDLSSPFGQVASGITLTRGASAGGDVAAMLNLPLATDSLGLRAVGYRRNEGGYIDDLGRDRRNVNDVRTTGGRLTLRARPASEVTIDLGLIGQRVMADDLQYAERGLRDLARSAALAQPFRQDYGLAQISVEQRWASGLTFVSATGYARRHAESRFDATRQRTVPVAYDTDERSRLFSQEFRLSRKGDNDAGWLVGVAMVRAIDLYGRRLGPIDRQREIVGTANRTTDAALFGQVGIALTPKLAVTLGERLTHQRSDGEPIAGKRARNFIRGVSVTRLDPTAGLSWLVAPGTALYARYQSGFRTGGITVAPGVGRVANLAPDTIHVAEAGVRHERQGPLGLAGSIGVSRADWRDVQADLIDPSGFPFTTNIGNSRVVGLEATGSWIPLAGLTLAAAAFIADTPLEARSRRIMQLRTDRVPNTPHVSASGSVEYAWRPTAVASASIGLDGRYVGHSVVGSVAPFDLRQGGFAIADAHAEWRQDQFRWTLSLDNLLDVRGDRFASGNPFAIATRPAYTPVRPRAVRIGVAADF